MATASGGHRTPDPLLSETLYFSQPPLTSTTSSTTGTDIMHILENTDLNKDFGTMIPMLQLAPSLLKNSIVHNEFCNLKLL